MVKDKMLAWFVDSLLDLYKSNPDFIAKISKYAKRDKSLENLIDEVKINILDDSMIDLKPYYSKNDSFSLEDYLFADFPSYDDYFLRFYELIDLSKKDAVVRQNNLRKPDKLIAKVELEKVVENIKSYGDVLDKLNNYLNDFTRRNTAFNQEHSDFERSDYINLKVKINHRNLRIKRMLDYFEVLKDTGVVKRLNEGVDLCDIKNRWFLEPIAKITYELYSSSRNK